MKKKTVFKTGRLLTIIIVALGLALTTSVISQAESYKRRALGWANRRASEAMTKFKGNNPQLSNASFENANRKSNQYSNALAGTCRGVQRANNWARDKYNRAKQGASSYYNRAKKYYYGR